MTREELVDKICPECNICNCDDRCCEDCNVQLNKWLDEYDKQVRAEAIEEFRNKLFGKLVRLTLSMWNFKLFDDILQETYKELQEQNK